MIPFNIPPYIGEEDKYLSMAIKENRKLSGDGKFTVACHDLLQSLTGVKKALLTTSCTHALEMATILYDIKPGDEVIMPSYTFVSTANAFVLRGATIVFVDIRPDTMNIDEKLIENAITNKTKAIVPVHYAGVGCEMDKIMEIASKHNLYVIEDAAQGIGSFYKGKPLGAIGDMGTFSFHETKNISCGEGGALLLRDDTHVLRAEVIREKGTNRSRFFRGEVDKYSWCDIGSSYLPSELNAAYLFAQLEQINQINQNRMNIWKYYYDNLIELAIKGLIELAQIPEHCTHNAHMFWIKASGIHERTKLISFLKQNGVHAVFHYVPLHDSEAGMKFGQFHGDDNFTTKESERLLRLPLYYGMSMKEMKHVVTQIKNHYI